jgi:pimeloyl-ACP methyl ester carboxylesterase
MTHLEDGSIHVAERELDELAARLRRTRWPAVSSRGWSTGPDPEELRAICAWWAEEFDWEAAQRRINRAGHALVDANGTAVHVAVHGDDDRRLPMLLLHGWPSTFLEFERLVPRLTADQRSGPVVVASLPGYGLSSRPERWTTRDTAASMVAVMRALGHDRFIAHGTDFGSAVATWMGLDHPEAVAGVHLSNVDLAPSVDEDALGGDERDYLRAFDQWWTGERGYKEIQSTRPDALAYGIGDSPAGLAAWVLDRWHQWTDPASGERLADRVGLEAIGETLTWLWLTDSIGTSLRDYVDNRAAGTTALPAGRRVQVPTAVARFAKVGDFVEDPPRAWLERMYRLERHEPMPRGGHFAALEAPDLLAEDLLSFAAALTGR